MKTITPFAWDRLAVFTVGSSNSAVSEALGVAYPGDTDLTGGLVFARSGAIVYKEELPYEPEKPEILSFRLAGKATLQIFGSENAEFEVEAQIVDGRAYYVLAPAKRG
jgi:hypothetical protein